jgi:tetratricopeptide (TPR) repeat protein
LTGNQAPARAHDVEALFALAERALETGEEEAAIPVLQAAAERHNGPRLWHWLGLLHRALDEHEEALACLEQAARLAPNGPKIAQARAHIAMEAGFPAVDLFERALRLAPQEGSVIIGLAAARVAAGEGERAVDELRAVLRQAPMWTLGQEKLAQFLATLGRLDEATSSIEEAIAANPAAPPLWEALLNVELHRRAYGTLGEVLARARSQGVESTQFPICDAIHAAEFDDRLFPPALFDSAPPALSDVLESWRVRHLLRLGAVDAALPILDRGLAGDHASELWAYAATAWRLAGDPRSQWLEDAAFVQVIDLEDALPPLPDLAAALRSLHVAKGEYLDQSVRGGTQTDGPLFSRVDPLIRRLRAAAAGAVKTYVDQLPPSDPAHPLLRHRRDRRIRFSGSWSVRLRSGGHHSNHVHPQGWVSSALYIALPDRRQGEEEDAGWLTIGKPDEKLGMDAAPWLKIEPKPGRLVLFPSWMWHGTVPFAEGERLTVAFDVRPPL